MFISTKILWVDGCAALIAGIFIFLTLDWLIHWLVLPRDLLLFMAIINLLYAVFSLTLAAFKNPLKPLILLLIAANSVWSLNCVRLAVNYAQSASVFGIGYLMGEAIIVGALAYIEWRCWQKLT